MTRDEPLRSFSVGRYRRAAEAVGAEIAAMEPPAEAWRRIGARLPA